MTTTLMSISLLAGIGVLNAQVACGLLSEWRQMRGCSDDIQQEVFQANQQASLRTALSAMPCLNSLFDRIDKPAKIYFVGLLFGLALDTATQVSLISIAAMSASAGGVPLMVTMTIPLCFSCGMCLVDTANGLLMLLAYSWALVRPAQKLLYNFIVTAMSAGVALLVGSFECLQILSQQAGFEGKFWQAIRNVDMASLGLGIMIMFMAVIGTSLLLRLRLSHCQCGATISIDV